ncbi:hypothetical protein [Ligilactobacillus salivarius]|uniref:Uncharacterized protein n=2 Tax=Ligilactobacillus salivarius TaxID=1624 RepID=A0A2A2X6D8_9LACO|nr:hypothetical protein [Ligilactobacillus salivarius]ATP38487.1 hypothetical protein CR531_10120 [Ligilactobacillus salivarius]EEJ73540.1 hypothetical protein HMPREF0545_1579 [Ligilactobacillus salivarius DSM 20555 = ATCC 11741]KRM68414.1 hypothetical protein FC55_GL001123 [Ligilactobacillus salivarius DSM 20555 = ATCC 11741]MBE7387238.1 hypothetical protein [Ligilactobacillus salivarius]MBE7391632.1 hypothetical protein [Ligilactobacillus salivarius]
MILPKIPMNIYFNDDDRLYLLATSLDEINDFEVSEDNQGLFMRRIKEAENIPEIVNILADYDMVCQEF